ncbi:hypothetical protein DBL02_12760 [Acinetobacter oleivorans]|uniref:hypothetical protein n=1 Tax=Acinetobacter oleivorans TaxID=1148157 RepID=UPI000D31ACCA|nr:hypothetical protein [Acinetobacter oleivorans]PTV44551.1 hypothetical protein DBL02_12760 [Acinetobacter oleivorans]
MIIDIPTKDDFFSSADDMVNEAWEKINNLSRNYHEIGESLIFLKKYNAPTEVQVLALEQFWFKERPKLISALTLILQSVEFRLKGLIAEISPYLLLSSSSKGIPKADKNGIISFAQFHSVDAQDLVKVYETFSNKKLNMKFKNWYEDIRILRNRFMHTVDKTSDINPEIIFKSIIIAHKYLVSVNQNWLQNRLNYLCKASEKEIDPDELGRLTLMVHSELFYVVHVCSREILFEIFKYDKSHDEDFCLNCLNVMGKYEFFDSRYVDFCIGTIQKNKRTHKYECIFCGSEQSPKFIK